MKKKFILLMLLALSLASCESSHPKIVIELESDYSQIISEIRGVNATLTEKLSAIEQKMADGFADNAAAQAAIKAAVASLEGTTAEKFAAVEAAVKAQTASLETKLALIEAAMEAGFADNAAAQGLIKDAITSLDGTMAEKLAAVEAAVKAQTTSLETKLGLIEKAVETGFADNAAAQGLIKEAIASLEGTTAAKLAAIEEAVKSQTSDLETKLAAIETAVKAGFADSAAAQDLIKKALESLGGTADTGLAAIEKAVKDQTTSFGTKLDLIEQALEKGFADGAKAQGLIEQAIKTLDSNTAGKLAEILQKITGLPNYSGGLDDIKKAIETLRKMFVLRVELDKSVLTLDIGETVTLTATVFPEDATDKSVTWKSSDPAVAEVSAVGEVTAKKPGTATITVTTNVGGHTATCEVTADHAYVDLGLPSGLLWATKNIGATAPEECGDFFAWGEVSPKRDYSWSTYKYANGADNKLTKYCPIGKPDFWGGSGSPDDKIVLEAEDDAARANWGSSWRMPTKDRIEELMDNCTVKCTTINGISGLNLTGPNGNSIFLPAAGYWNGGSYYDNWNMLGYYLSTSCDTDSPNGAWNLHFSSTTGQHTMKSCMRTLGMPIRPVLAGIKISVTGVKLRPALTLPVGGSATLVASVIPSDADDRTVIWKSSDPSAVEVSQTGEVTAKKPGGTATITVTTTDGGKEATCTVTVNALVNGHECVDMGIEVGGKNIRWATCNVGATKPEEYGDYFAWGDTTTLYTTLTPSVGWKPGKEAGYTWENYKFRTEGNNLNNVKFSRYNTKSDYGTVDNDTTLYLEDDAARHKWGDSWRMPTDGELRALADTKSNEGYEWTWCDGSTVKYNNTTAVGWQIERKSTGATLFLPAAGRRYGANLRLDGSHGYYWSSSLYTDYPSGAWYLNFNSDSVDSSGYDRSFGLPVRPVTD